MNGAKQSDKKATVSVRQKQKKKRKLKRLLLVLLVILVPIAGIAFSVACYQENNIQALTYANQYSQEELKQKNEDLKNQMQAAVAQLPDMRIQALTDAERKQLHSGELTAEEAMRIITGMRREAEVGDAADSVVVDGIDAPVAEDTTAAENAAKDTSADNALANDGEATESNTVEETVKAPEPEPVQTVSKINQLIAEFYLLEAEFLNKIDDLIEQGKAERQSIPKEERTLSVKLDMAKKYAKLGSALEAECDKRVNTLLEQLETELKATGQSTSIVTDIKNFYSEEKAIKKAALIDSYYPKG